MKEFWYEVSRELPLKKFVKKRVQTYMLETSYIQAYKQFKKSRPELKVGYVSFIKLKPPNVREMKALERVVCCCIKCENVTHCIRALNHFAVQHNHSQLQVPGTRQRYRQLLYVQTRQEMKPPASNGPAKTVG